MGSLSTTLIQTEMSYIGWISMTFCRGTRGPQRLGPDDFGDFFSATMTFVVWSERSEQQMEGLS